MNRWGWLQARTPFHHPRELPLLADPFLTHPTSRFFAHVSGLLVADVAFGFHHRRIQVHGFGVAFVAAGTSDGDGAKNRQQG